MSEDLNSSPGRITGKISQEDKTAGRIIGKSTAQGTSGNNDAPGEKLFSEKKGDTRKQRIAFATEHKGLQSLPLNFGDTDGDWKIIESDDLFEVLYLSREKIAFIDPDLVKNNYQLLEKFWKEKRNLWDSGSGQVRKSMEDKYKENNLSVCLKKIENAFDQLSTLEKISDYYLKLQQLRLSKAEIALEPFFKLTMRDGEIDSHEIESIFEEGTKHDLDVEEVAIIIKKTIDSKNFKAFGNPSGKLLSEQLLSVSWMTEDKKLEREKQSINNRREIFDNVFAYSVEDIGRIIFNDEKQTKSYIAKGLLKNSIDFFSPAKANQFLKITEQQTNEHLRYLQVVYRLNPALPYRFNSNCDVASIKELVGVFSKTLEDYNSGKDQFKKGCIETWLYETNDDAYQKIQKLKESSVSAETAFVALLYTFDPELPYRFAGNTVVKNVHELSEAINANAANWSAGKKELYDGLITAWLEHTGKSAIVTKWENLKNNFASQDIGLEAFLHILDEKLAFADIHTSLHKIEYPRIQSGKAVQTDITFNLSNRGYAACSFSFSKDIAGVSLSENKLDFNAAAGATSKSLVLQIDSNLLLKGVNYETDIIMTSSIGQKMEIPVTFRIVFPKNAFILQTSLYSVIIAAFFVLMRYFISTAHPGWLGSEYSTFIGYEQAFYMAPSFRIFAGTFFIFLALSITGIYFLVKYLRHDPK